MTTEIRCPCCHLVVSNEQHFKVEREEEQADMFGLDTSQDLLAGPPDDVLDDRLKWPEGLAFLAEHTEAALMRLGFDKGPAFRLANVVLSSLAFAAGGRVFYLPNGDVLQKAMRDREIWHQFNGRNVNELADKYKMTAVHVYHILKRQRALNKLQGSFDFDEAN